MDGGLFQVYIVGNQCLKKSFIVHLFWFGLQDTVFALCLDSLGNGEQLNVHVSKPPKDGSNIASFLKVGLLD